MLTCDVTAVPVDAVAVEALARLALGARRHGCEVALRGATVHLCALIELVGLSDALRPTDAAAPGSRPPRVGSRAAQGSS